MFDQERTCQDSCMRGASGRVPRAQVLVIRTREYLRQHGLVRTAQRITSFLRRRADGLLGRQRVRVEAQIQEEEVLNLQPGAMVEVKSEEEIRRTLDSSDKSRGLGFMAGMVRHCGKRYRVYKRVRTIILEGTGEVRQLRNTVLLDGVICDGEHLVCDRSCFYFWKESWLRRVIPEGAEDKLSSFSR